MKTLHNTTANGARKNVGDIQFWGNSGTFKLISKTSSETEGWTRTTRAMEIPGVGCVVQVSTQQRNGTYNPELPDDQGVSYSIAEAVTFVPGVRIEEERDAKGKIVGHKLAAIGA